MRNRSGTIAWMLSGVGAAVVALTVLALGSAGADARRETAATTATAVTFRVAPGGSDDAPCTVSRPCSTLQRAVDRATGGDTVELAAGGYERQTIRASAKPRSGTVVIQPAARAAVTINGLALGDSELGNAPTGLVLRDLSLGGYPLEIFEAAAGILVERMTAGNFYIRGVRNLTVRGGSWGPCLTDGVSGVCGNNKLDHADPPYTNTNVVIEDAVFHDYRVVPGSGAHFECLFLLGGTDITIRRNRFVNCEFFDIFLQYLRSGFEGLEISDNVFGPPLDGQNERRETAILFSGRGYRWSNVAVLRNSFVDSAVFFDDGTGGGFANVVAANNLFGRTPGCDAGVSYTGNLLFDGRPCGPEDSTKPPYGYTLTSGALLRMPQQARAIARVFELAASGRTVPEITTTARKERLQAPRGGWSWATVRALLQNRLYLGGQYGGVGAHPALTSSKRFTTASKIARAVIRKAKPKAKSAG